MPSKAPLDPESNNSWCSLALNFFRETHASVGEGDGDGGQGGSTCGWGGNQGRSLTREQKLAPKWPWEPRQRWWLFIHLNKQLLRAMVKKKNHPLITEHLPEDVIYREKRQMEFQVVHDSPC